jgi:hypothetical protein
MVNTQAVIQQAEQTIALARLAEVLRTVEACVLRRPAGDDLTPRREVVLVVPNDTAAQTLVEAIRNASTRT